MRDEPRVYFIKPVGMDGPIKIGCSAKPAVRLLALSAWSPFPLELIGEVPGDFSDENLLHRRFSDLHTRKEWFMSSPALRQTIEKILSGTPIKDACKALKAKGPIRRKQPERTPDRELFMAYGRRVRSAAQSVDRKGDNGKRYIPADVQSIMHNWRMDRMVGHLPITPTAEQFARLEEFIADPKTHCVSFDEAHPEFALRRKRLIASAEHSPDAIAPAETFRPLGPSSVGATISTGAS